jgi:hypothetical protein
MPKIRPRFIISVFIFFDFLRRSKLIIILLLGLIPQLLQLILILLKLRLAIQPLLISGVGDLARASGNGGPLLNSRSIVDSLPPLFHIRKFGQIHSSEVCDVDPGEVGNVGDGVFAFSGTDEVVAGVQLGVQDTIETFSFPDISLCRIRDSLWEGRKNVSLECEEG